MRIASYRNTEKGIRAIQHKSVVLPFIMPVKPQAIAVDRSLVAVTRVNFDRFLDAVGAEMAALRLAEKQRRYRAQFERIVERLCRVFRVTFSDICSDRRDLATVQARLAIYYWAWRITPLSTPQIAARLKRRDHSTVLYGVTSYQHKRAQMGRSLRELRRAQT